MSCTAASCELTTGIKGGRLTWGFKKSFRSYAAGPAGNSVTAGDGRKILAQDLAVPGNHNRNHFRKQTFRKEAFRKQRERR
ncbi:HtaA domain-containing protein [Streptomyces sp. AK02-01A]|uniref:HtaA domain-containing protein n=1 Tax=Streptomyces sp. AK02-01A TaxID=3028648 RepID=UPI0039F73FF4